MTERKTEPHGKWVSGVSRIAAPSRSKTGLRGSKQAHDKL